MERTAPAGHVAQAARSPAGTAAATTPVVEVDGLQMRYGDRDVLTNVTFQVDRGEVICLLGPNGAGKTTTIEVLEGFRMRSGGRVRLFGVDPAHAGEDWRSRVGVALQSWRDHARWTPRRLLAHLRAFYLPYRGPGHPGPFETEELLTAVGLADLSDQRIWTLSGGQRRRLDVAIGLVGRPELLFLDEPTAPFDPQARRAFHELIERIAAEHGTTIVLTTHDLHEAERLADRILVLAEGRIVADGTAEELARTLGTDATIRWRHGGRSHVQHSDDATAFVRELLTGCDGVAELSVHRPSLEDTYLALIGEQTGGQGAATATSREGTS
ncbi:MAG TPA: ABC transporter ATP-binding protein [Beutenbergiaceae bacterium]|nr:ABC transporter ATP-binding protein [Beutenbergiaceae bacterium]